MWLHQVLSDSLQPHELGLQASLQASVAGFPVLHYLLDLLKHMSIEPVMQFNHLILCHPFLLLPSTFPSIRVFSSELAFRIRWPKYWSFSISPSNDAIKVLHLICQQIWKTQQWPQNWKRSIFIPIPKKGNAKECSNYHTIAFLSHASKIMLKILQARLQQYMNPELPDVQAGFRNSRGTRNQIANIRWITEKAREFQK